MDTRVKWTAAIAVGLLIAGISAAAAYWMIGRAEKEHQLRCQDNLRQIELAATLYASDYGGPFGPGFDVLLQKELISAEALQCPSDRTSGTQEVAGHKCSYIWLGRNLNSKKSEPTCVLAYEPISNHGSRSNFLFVGGAVAVPVEAETAKAAIKELEQGRNPPQISSPQWNEVTSYLLR